MNRIDFIKNVFGLFGASVLPINAFQEYEKIYVLQCFVRGFKYYEGPKLLNIMTNGSSLQLVREPNNKYDEDAIKLVYNNKKIGYIPAEENSLLSKIIDANLLELVAEISHVEPNAATWENVHIAIYVLKVKETNNNQYIHLTQLETPYFHSFKNDILFKTNDTYYKTSNEENYVMDADEFYEAMVENSETDDVYSIIHNTFENGDKMEEALKQQKFVIQTQKLNLELKADNVIKAFDDSIILLDDTFGDKGYVMANINRVAELSPKIDRFEEIIDKAGRTFYEIVFKKMQKPKLESKKCKNGER